MSVMVLVLILAAVECGRRGLVRTRVARAAALARIDEIPRKQTTAATGDGRSGVTSRRVGDIAARHRIRLLALGGGLLAAAGGLRLAGPLGIVAGAAVGATIPHLVRRRQVRKLEVELERQLADLAESTAMAVRSGFSIAQAMAFAAEEAVPPMSGILSRFIRQQDLGTPFEVALRHLAEDLGTPDARLFALIVSIHARSGGNLAVSLDEVAGTIRHRVAVRRELRALSAQGRISGSILGALPVAFFLVLAATSHQELAPIYRTPIGMAMISSGLLMEGLAFMWIRRLLRVET